MIVRAKTSAHMFSHVAQIRLFWLIFSLIGGVTALKRALVMKQVSGPCLLMFVSVLRCVFTFELQSEYTANITRFFWFLSALLVLVFMKLLIYKMLCNIWFYVVWSVL